MRILRVSLAVVCLLAATTGNAQRIFMKVMDPGQIPGETFQQNFPNWSEIIAFNGGSATEISTPGGIPNPAPPETKCFTISMRQDKVSYWFKKEMYSGTVINSIQLDFVKTTNAPTPETYYRVLVENALVTAIEEAASEDGQITMNISFVPRRFRYTYWPQNSNGSLGTPVIFGWDVIANHSW